MAGKNPAAMWYFNDWVRDLGPHPAEIGGYWMLVLSDLHWQEDRGKATKTVEQWSRILRTDADTTQRVLNYILNEKIAVGNAESQNNNGKITIECRRMVKEQKERELNRLRQQRHKKKKGGNAKVTDKSQKSHNPSSITSSITPPYSSSINKDIVSSKEDTRPRSKSGSSCPHKEIIEVYHEELPELPRVRVWNETSKRNLRSRWSEDKERQTVGWWRTWFREEVSPSDWLMGRVKDFRADLSWLVGPVNFAKVMNGRFVVKEAPTSPRRKTVAEILEERKSHGQDAMG